VSGEYLLQAKYLDGSFPHQRAVVLADTATDTQLTQNIRPLQGYHFASRIRQPDFLQADGFFRRRAKLRLGMAAEGQACPQALQP
jgi:hypothetical protein